VDLDLRDEIQWIALEFLYYGWPRITAETEKRGWQANHKPVYRIVRKDNLLSAGSRLKSGTWFQLGVFRTDAWRVMRYWIGSRI
jgi:helix-turn-helix protein